MTKKQRDFVLQFVKSIRKAKYSTPKGYEYVVDFGDEDDFEYDFTGDDLWYCIKRNLLHKKYGLNQDNPILDDIWLELTKDLKLSPNTHSDFWVT